MFYDNYRGILKRNNCLILSSVRANKCCTVLLHDCLQTTVQPFRQHKCIIDIFYKTHLTENKSQSIVSTLPIHTNNDLAISRTIA